MDEEELSVQGELSVAVSDWDWVSIRRSNLKLKIRLGVKGDMG